MKLSSENVPGTQSHREAIGISLQRMGVELGLISTLVDEFEDGLSNILTGNAVLGGIESQKLQKLDQIKQHIDCLAQYMAVLALSTKKEWQVDGSAALRQISLSSLAKRLGGIGIAATVSQPSMEGELELFDDIPNPQKVSAKRNLVRPERRSCCVPARFGIKTGEIRGKITNISSSGIGIILDSTIRLSPGERIFVSVGIISNIVCDVRWESHPRYGAVLDVHPSVAKRMMSLLAP